MAKLVGDSTISLDELSQEIDMTKYFGKKPTREQVELFAEIAVELINNRTLDGNSVGGKKKFTRYSKEYAKSKGVSRNGVNLFLEGTMLDSVDATSDDTSVKISLDGNSTDIKKGYNHQIGDTLPTRQWFGLNGNEAQTIADVIGTENKDVLDAISNSFATKPKATKAVSLSELEDALNSLGLEQIE